MRNPSQAALLGLVAMSLLLACSGASVPLSAQKGSTILIPIGGMLDEDDGLIGFGSQLYEDRQRGALVFKLDGPSGAELSTRVVTALAGPLASAHGIASPFGYRTDLLVAMVDIPNTPAITEGTHGLYIVRRLGGIDHAGPAYDHQISILPASIIAGAETIVGAPTPLEALGLDISTVVKNAVPDPQALFAVHIGPPVHALEIDVTFPSSLVNIKDVTEAAIGNGTGYFDGVSESHRAHSWHKTLSAGRLAVSMLSPDRPLRGISVVFALKAAATGPVPPSAFAIENVRAYGPNGDAITPGWDGPWIR